MIHIQRKLRCKFTGPDGYLQSGIEPGKWMNVIGYEIRNREREYDGKKSVIGEIYFVVIGNNGKVSVIASFNCETRIDDHAEISGGQIVQLMTNILTMGKVLSEKLAKKSTEDGS